MEGWNKCIWSHSALKVNTRLQSFFFFFLSYLMREASSAPCEGPFCRQSCVCVRLHDNCGGLCNVRCAAANKKTPLWTDVMRLQLHYTPVVLFIFINCSRNVSHSRLGVVYSAAPLTDYFILFMGRIFLNLTLLYYPVYVELIKMRMSVEERSPHWWKYRWKGRNSRSWLIKWVTCWLKVVWPWRRLKCFSLSELSNIFSIFFFFFFLGFFF